MTVNPIPELSLSGEDYDVALVEYLISEGFDVDKIQKLSGAAGHSSRVLDLGDSKRILKITNKDNIEDESSYLPNIPCVLQPLQKKLFAGLYLVAIYPKLRTQGVGLNHIKYLKSAALNFGYNFNDCKAENIGLLEYKGKVIPYIIDGDSLSRVQGSERNMSCEEEELWPSSQEIMSLVSNLSR